MLLLFNFDFAYDRSVKKKKKKKRNVSRSFVCVPISSEGYDSAMQLEWL